MCFLELLHTFPTQFSLNSSCISLIVFDEVRARQEGSLFTLITENRKKSADMLLDAERRQSKILEQEVNKQRCTGLSPSPPFPVRRDVRFDVGTFTNPPVVGSEEVSVPVLSPLVTHGLPRDLSSGQSLGPSLDGQLTSPSSPLLYHQEMPKESPSSPFLPQEQNLHNFPPKLMTLIRNTSTSSDYLDILNQLPHAGVTLPNIDFSKKGDDWLCTIQLNIGGTQICVDAPAATKKIAKLKAGQLVIETLRAAFLS
eukprot:TRINITY_DN11124_c0_g1_i8.p1 TRINITY_DN11124_c0_g1~~TRINITY_DN11124_c0_g1_i8.p1  ORF type:complete len:255 (+),score=50.77 TRINITY_DN11124_c0_g1_i8:309-1073(+)